MTSISASVPPSSKSLPFTGSPPSFTSAGGNTEPRAVLQTSAESSTSLSAAAAASASAVTSPITTFSRLCFLDCLSNLVGRKLLLLDETLAGSLSLLVDTATLQQHGVDRCYPLRAFPLPASSLSTGAQSAPYVIFICRPRLLLLPLIAQHIHFIERTYQPTQPPSLSTSPSAGASLSPPCSFSPSGRHFFVLFVPSSSDFLSSELRRLLSNPPSLSSSPSSRPASSFISNLSSLPAALTNTILFNGGPTGSPAPPFDADSSPVQLNLDSTTIAGCPLYFFPLAPDVLSLELPNAFRDIHVHGDPSPCLHAAAAIQVLQQELQNNTVVPHLRCLGSAAKTVADYLIQQRKEKQAAEQQQILWGEGTCSSSSLWGAGPRSFAGRSSSTPESERDALHQFVPVAPPVRFVLSKDDLEPGGSDAASSQASPGEKDSRLGACVSQGAQRGRVDTTPAERKVGGGGGGVVNCPAGLPERSTATEENRGVPNVTPAGGGRGARGEAGGTSPAVKVDMLVLIDRRSDLITPLCSAFTYEALLDIVFGIEAAALEVPQQLLQQQHQQQQSSSGGGGASSSAPQAGKAVPVLLPGGRKQKIPLSSDGLFATLRDLHQSAVGSQLHRIASEIQQIYKEKDELRSIQEISVFMNKFKIKQQEHSSLSLHVRLASFLASVTKDPAFFQRLTLEDELLQSAGGGTGAGGSGGGSLTASMMSQLENMIDSTAVSGDLWWVPSLSGDVTGLPGTGGGAGTGGRLSGHSAKPVAAPCVEDVYRLLCLASLLNGGLKGKQLEGLKRGLVQQHGLKEAVRMAHLQQVGLLRQVDGGGASSSGGAGKGACGVGSWKTLKKECRLMVDEDQSARDIAYACSGYAPLSVR